MLGSPCAWDYDILLHFFTFMLLYFFTFPAGAQGSCTQPTSRHIHTGLFCDYTVCVRWQTYGDTEVIPILMQESVGWAHCPFSNKHADTHTHTHVLVLFKEVQLNVLLNIISLPTFINLPLYRKAGKVSIDRDLPRIWQLKPIRAAARCNSSL